MNPECHNYGALFHSDENSKLMAITLKEIQKNILKQWAKDPINRQLFEVKHIDIAFFIKYFGKKYLKHVISVLEGSDKIGTCTIMAVMVQFFTTKKFLVQDFFICCASFKNSVSLLLFEHDVLLKKKSFAAFYKVCDINFAIASEQLYETFVRSSQMRLPQEFVILEVFHTQKASPETSVSILESEPDSLISSDDIDELEDFESDIIFLIEKITKKKETKQIKKLSGKIAKFANILSFYPTFDTLSISLKELAEFFYKGASDPVMIAEIDNMLYLIDSFINDLIVWRKQINTLHDDPNYYDASIIGNIKQIMAFLDSSGEMDEIEFF